MSLRGSVQLCTQMTDVSLETESVTVNRFFKSLINRHVQSVLRAISQMNIAKSDSKQAAYWDIGRRASTTPARWLAARAACWLSAGDSHPSALPPSPRTSRPSPNTRLFLRELKSASTSGAAREMEHEKSCLGARVAAQLMRRRPFCGFKTF